MATLQEILNDRTTYPDDTKYQVGDTQMTLGEMRNAVGFKSDFNRELERMKQTEQEYARQLAASQYQLQQMNAELERRGQTAQPTVDDALVALERDSSDPTLGPYAKSIRKMQTQLAEALKRVDDAEKRAKQHEETWWLDKHAQVANRIREKDDEFRDPQKMQGLFQFAQQHGIGNLDLAYSLMTRDRDLKRAEEQAVKVHEAKLAEQQKVNAGAPTIPSGVRSTSPAAPSDRYVPPADAPDPWEAAKRAAIEDPDLERIGAEWATGQVPRA